MSVAVDFGAPPAPRPAWFPTAARLLADAPAAEVLAWAVGRVRRRPDRGLLDAGRRGRAPGRAGRPGVEVVFLDTGFHFPETLATARRAAGPLRGQPGDAPPGDKAAADRSAGTAALLRGPQGRAAGAAPAERAAWVTGLRRAESPSRAEGGRRSNGTRPGVSSRSTRSWTGATTTSTATSPSHDMIVNPLRDKGYDSIGCQPCTLPGAGRGGRWAGSDKLECGLHVGRAG